MSVDNVNPALDAERLFQTHNAYLETLNPLDKNSVYFGRPDLAAKHRADAELHFNALLNRAGITAPPPVTPEILAEQQHEASFHFLEMPPAEAEFIEQRIEAAEQLTKEARAENIAQIKRDLGAEAWQSKVRVGMLVGGVPSDRNAFITEAGEAAYKQMVEDAKSAFDKPGDLPEAVFADNYSLRTLAARGRYLAAYDRTKPGKR